MPKTGYRSDAKTRYLDNSGFKKFLITNAKDLEILLTNNRTFAGFIFNVRNLKVNWPITFLPVKELP
jgi:ribosomal protein L32E